MQRQTRGLFQRLGFDVVRYPVHTTRQGHLKAFFDASGVSTVLDVGANQGQFGRSLRDECGFRGSVVSFEPFPDSRRILEEASARDPLWLVKPFALGDSNAQIDLQTFERSEWNSLLPPDSARLASVGRALVSTGSVSVAVRRLDGIWNECVGPDEVVFLKSDTQGHDLSVLAGAAGHLEDVQGLLLEASIVPFYEGEPTLSEMVLEVAAHGFSPTGFFPVARSKHSLALTTVDICFIRDA